MRFAEERIFGDRLNIFMLVSSFNTSARRLCERLGYRPIGELADFIIPGHSESLPRKSGEPLLGYRASSGSGGAAAG
jgi:hypothetical protein